MSYNIFFYAHTKIPIISIVKLMKYQKLQIKLLNWIKIFNG